MGQINSSYGSLAAKIGGETGLTQAQHGAEEMRAQRQALSKATQVLNEAGFAGEGREVTFTLDSATKRPVIKVIDAQSKEVVVQWPAEYVLRMAEELNQLKRNSG